MQEHRIEVAARFRDALAAVSAAAEDWGAEWREEGQGGRLRLPVSAGLRHGFLEGRVRVEGRGDRAAVTLAVEAIEYRLHKSAVAMLVIGAGGAVALVAWPFFPQLLALAPTGVVLAIVAWLVVVSRLRNSGPEEFLELVSTIAGQGGG